MLTSYGGEGFTVLMGKMDIGAGFQIDPCKIEVEKPSKIPITIYNTSGKTISLVINIRTPDSLKDGFKAHDSGDEYEIKTDIHTAGIQPNGKVTFNITVNGKGDNREAWVSVKETENQINYELIVRLLMKGGENK